ncbi:multicopper oxidase domain-containing protein [Aestuariimicrobium sp. p3-SID1156]|uniref:multicopper oxidase domain-containing protein n=1 Tax=Aestuariimicrobium sp. p3-SID1156 TaxID=2916038 RepID=UPI00223AB538|nr:multicopper oxidase domain-containing protein [Aestuariimicrobium sp. p3-SID1156]MCT1458212.1 multicopper oxidase domain-containing protein [Aestuariimicrobium sp. p3-SID1156]
MEGVIDLSSRLAADRPSRPSGQRDALDRRAWHRKASRPVMAWLVALIVLGFIHRWIPQSRWLLVHMATLGVVTNSILIWSQHFADSLLHARRTDSSHSKQVMRMRLLNLGIVVTSAGMVGEWPWVTTVGATVVGLALLWHAASLANQSKAALPARFGHVVRWYLAAAALLPAGAVIGAIMSFSQPEPWQGRLLIAHLLLNVLGFVGLTATATLLTLWPTMLRTPMAGWSEKAHRIALPLMLAAVLVGATGAALGWRWVAVAGLGAWLVGLGFAAAPAIAVARRKPPKDFPTWSVAAAVVWVAGCIAWLLWQVATREVMDAEGVKSPTGPLVAGGLVQLVLGAMSYLMPVVMGGGPRTVRATNAVMNRAWALRVSLANAGLVAYLLAESSMARVVSSLLVFGAYAAIVPLILSMVRTFTTVRLENPQSKTIPVAPSAVGTPAAVIEQTANRGRRDLIEGAVGLGAVVGAMALFDRRRIGGGGRQGQNVPATGRTVEATVSAKDMRFIPDHVEVNPGDRVVIHLTNDDPTQVHDLYFASGVTSGRLKHGQKSTLDLGVVGQPLEGWCTIVGHRAMGMVFHVRTTGSTAAAATTAPHQQHQQQPIDLAAKPGKNFRTRSAVVPETPAGDVTHEFVVTESVQEFAPGVTQNAMTYNGRVMGPLVQASLGRTVTVRLRNKGTMGHSIDFHAGDVSPNQVMRTIAPGEELVYPFVARRSGIWLYHCSTMPLSAHVAAGMYGAVIVPPTGLATVDREYYLVQQDAYLGPEGGEVDSAKIAEERPDLVMWNGHANQYVHDPLVARVGERVRIWVLAAGPSRGTTFHVVGSQFDTVFKEGEWLLRPNAHGGGSQALDLGPCQGGFVEMVFREPGTYTFVNHSFASMEKGARGLITVT